MLHSEPKIVPITPARGLYVPIFDADGAKIWEIRGVMGEVQGDSSVVVSDMLINRCEGNGGTALTIESERANLTSASHLVAGNSTVRMNGGNFSAVARDWKFFGEERRFVAERDVKVVFSGKMAEPDRP